MLRLIGTLLVWLGVVVGSAAVLTIYQPKVTTQDSALVGLTLDRKKTIYVAPQSAPDSPEQIVYNRNDTVTPEMLENLRQAPNVSRVVVREFAWRAWTEWWIFLIGSAMMVCGAIFLRLHSRREIAKVADLDHQSEASPQSSVIAMRAALERLAHELPSLPDDSMRCDTIVTRLDVAQQSYVPNFVNGRAALIGKHGLAGYAGIMDRFATLERQINRAWSSAADGYFDESAACIAVALETLPEVEQRLGIPSRSKSTGESGS